jgi:hypothetical protein
MYVATVVNYARKSFIRLTPSASSHPLLEANMKEKESALASKMQ